MAETIDKPNAVIGEEPKHRKLKIALDMASGLSVFYMMVGVLVWAHYEPDGPNPDGKMWLGLKLAFIDAPLFIFGQIWLLYRYGETMRRILPFFSKAADNLLYRLLFILSIPVYYFVGYVILKITLFSWIP